MKKITAILLLAGIAFACRYSTAPAETELKEKLKERMTIFLYKSNKLYNNDSIDSSAVKFNVLDVIYFNGPDEYSCKFTVHMREHNRDTVGFMNATISKDLTKVARAGLHGH